MIIQRDGVIHAVRLNPKVFRRSIGGIFIFRIEYTDLERSRAPYQTSIENDLKWLGLEWDEGPYRQTDRFDLYRSYAQGLLEAGWAYKCFCSKEELERERAEAVRKGVPPGYGGRCRDLSSAVIAGYEREGRPFVLRFRSPGTRISFPDAIHGPMEFPPGHVEDFIIVREDQSPSYNLAASIDDLEMNITHVIRGSDHLSNTPKQIMLFHAFHKDPPTYAHHGLVTGPDRRPLSKRHGATTITEFAEMGIVNGALFNYLGTMGRKVDKEFRTAGEMVAGFSLDSLAPSDSLFDMEKLLWLNKEHLKTMDLPALLALLSLPDAYGEKVRLLRENAQTLVRLKGLLGIFEHVEVEEEGVAFLSEVEGIDRLLPYLREAVVKESLDMEQAVHDIKEMTGLDRKSSFLSLRIALTGRKSGPPLKEVFRLMSKDSILKRIEWLEMRLQEPRSI